MQAHSEQTVIVGDNLRTDILAGFQAGLETILVLSGVPRSTISTACRSALRGFILRCGNRYFLNKTTSWTWFLFLSS
jgi:ribonucleotide monophosphatase NagD (HAD superfamily)